MAAAATSLSAGWSRLSTQVPGFFARPPGGSDHGSPSSVGATSAQPNPSFAATEAAPGAAAAAAPVPGHGQPGKRCVSCGFACICMQMVGQKGDASYSLEVFACN